MRKTRTKAEFQGGQSVWLRATLNLEDDRIDMLFQRPLFIVESFRKSFRR